MRILMLAQFYPPVIEDEEHHVRSLSIELAARGHDVAVATLCSEGLPEYEEEHGVRVYRIASPSCRIPEIHHDAGRPCVPPVPDPEAILALRRILRKERPEVVHAHNWLVYSFLPLKRWSGARLVMTLHNYQLVCAKTSMHLPDKLFDKYNNAPGSSSAPGKFPSCTRDAYETSRGAPIVLGNRIMSQLERRAVDMFVAVSNAVAVHNRLEAHALPYRVIPNFLPSTPEFQASGVVSRIEQVYERVVS